LLLTRFANEKNEGIAPEIFMGNLRLNKKYVLEICPGLRQIALDITQKNCRNK